MTRIAACLLAQASLCALSPAQDRLATIRPPAAWPQGRFGSALATDGDRAIVGAWWGNGNRGVACVYLRSGTDWSLEASLRASDAAVGDRFGHSVGLDGDRAIVGAIGKTGSAGLFQGGAYVFERQGSSWTEVVQLQATDPAPFASFGSAVAIRGDRAVVGAQFATDAQGTTTGAAYVHDRAGGSWTHVQKLVGSGTFHQSLFGTALALDDARVVVGSPGDAYGPSPAAGKVYVYGTLGGQLVERARLTADDGFPGDLLGWSVALDGARLIAGAPMFRLSSAGAIMLTFGPGRAYLFADDGTAWSEEGRLAAPDGQEGDLLGLSVALAGDVAWAGAPLDGLKGSVRGFLRQGSWQQQLLLASTTVPFNGNFGWAVAWDGRNVLVGEPGRPQGGVPVGAVHVYGLAPGSPGIALCFGAGTGAACPCGNAGGPGEGCAHSSGVGMRLGGSGTPSVSADDLVLAVHGCPPNNTGLFVVGTDLEGAGLPFRDGLRCVGGGLLQFRGVHQLDGSASDRQFVQQSGGGYFAPGGTYFFQYLSRDTRSSASPCGGFANLSPAYRVVAAP